MIKSLEKVVLLREQTETRHCTREKIISAARPFLLGTDALASPKKYNGFMGISQGKPYFADKQNIEAYMLFALENFDRFLFVIDDYLANHNYAAFHRMSDTEAMHKAQIHGRAAVAMFERVKRKLGLEGYDISRISIIPISSLVDEQVQRDTNMIYHHFKEDPHFRADCLAWFSRYMSHRVDSLPKPEQEAATARGIRYLLDELPLLYSFARRGYTIEIYPGYNAVQQGIFTGKYPSLTMALSPLPQYGALEVYVKDPVITRVAKLFHPKNKTTLVGMENRIKDTSIISAALMSILVAGSLGVMCVRDSILQHEWHRQVYGDVLCTHRRVLIPGAGAPMAVCYFDYAKSFNVRSFGELK